VDGRGDGYVRQRKRALYALLNQVDARERSKKEGSIGKCEQATGKRALRRHLERAETCIRGHCQTSAYRKSAGAKRKT